MNKENTKLAQKKDYFKSDGSRWNLEQTESGEWIVWMPVKNSPTRKRFFAKSPSLKEALSLIDQWRLTLCH